ncbi:histone deacetylase family protein [Onishia niordana]|uniref:histone deacetylase family protein n=1 Tax=Onishia niordana TaxID=2508711 RepID=UPI00109FF5E6|nr:histone deacetylase [Halomonas niordiana]
MLLPLIHHSGYTIEMPPRHPFPMAKFRVLRETLAAEKLEHLAEWITPQPASEASLARVHTADYLHAFLGGTLNESAQRRSGFRWSESLVARTLLEVGGTQASVEAALDTGLACNTAGGTHHAHADAASGYCLINDLAVAAAHALDRRWVKRILIVDLDVHQGDGTARLFRNDQRVFTFSMHGAENFPARKQHSDLDIALPRGTGNLDYLARLRASLPPLLVQFAPDLVLYDAGVDVHADDRLGHLALCDDGLFARDHYVLGTCRDAHIPVAAVIGGGYDRDLEALANRHAQLHRAASTLL